MNKARTFTENLAENTSKAAAIAGCFIMLVLYLAGLPVGLWLAVQIIGETGGPWTLQTWIGVLIAVVIEGVWIVVYDAALETFLHS